MKKIKIEIGNGKTIKIMFIILIILLALPSIIFIITGNNLLDLNSDYRYNIINFNPLKLNKTL